MEFLNRRAGIFLSIALLAVLLHLPVSAIAATVSPLDVKFAFINNFTKYVTWPPKTFVSDTATFRACVMADGAVSKAFEKYGESIVTTYKIETYRINNVSDAAKCHFIFFGESADQSLAKVVLKSVEKKPVLTIGDYSGFIHQGGIIRFIVVDKRLAFEINPAAAKRSDLDISSKLLKLAKIVAE